MIDAGRMINERTARNQISDSLFNIIVNKRIKPADVPDWDALLGYWERNLTRLATAYAGGDARVDPKQASTCEYCHLSTLCRIHELRGAEGPWR